MNIINLDKIRNKNFREAAAKAHSRFTRIGIRILRQSERGEELFTTSKRARERIVCQRAQRVKFLSINKLSIMVSENCKNNIIGFSI